MILLLDFNWDQYLFSLFCYNIFYVLFLQREVMTKVLSSLVIGHKSRSVPDLLDY